MDTRSNERPTIEEADGVAFAAVIRTRPDRPSRPMVAALAIFGAGVLVGLLLQGRGAHEAAQAAASPGPTTTAVMPTASSRAPTPPAHPTPPPIGTFPPLANGWQLGGLDLGANAGSTDVWSVGGAFVVLTSVGNDSTFQSSVDGRTWDPSEPSPAIVNYQAATVIDGELWFVATVVGVADAHFELVHTTPGGPVLTLGPAKGAAPDWARVLNRVGRSWVMSHGQYLPDGMGDGGREDLQASSDGVHWTTIHPDGLDSLSYIGSGSLGRKMVVLANPGPTIVETLALVSTDGLTWQSASVPEMDGASIFDMACGPAACVAVGTASSNGLDIPMAWVTTDGLSWVQVPQEMSRGESTTPIVAVAATEQGFVAVGGGDLWLSADGAIWQEFPVLPQGAGSIDLVAANGDRILAIGEDFKGVPSSWIGSLSTIRG